jgi:hypothetical protein
MSIDDIIRKIQSFSHREYDTIEYKTREHVYNAINNGIDIFNRSDIEMVPFVDIELLPPNWELIQNYLNEKQQLQFE